MQPCFIPFVEREYRTNRDRGLYGHSLGRLFATYVLITDPDLFDRYGISSPSLFWDNEEIFSREAAFRALNRPLRKRVHLQVAGLDPLYMAALMWRMAVALNQFEGISVTAEVIEREDHMSPVLVWHALKTLYPPRQAAK